MSKLKTFIILLITVAGIRITKAQITVNLSPSKDAYLLMSLRPGSEYMGNTNYGTQIKFNSGEWTSGGYRVKERSIIDFNFSIIPQGAVIQEAKLSLYAMQPQPNDEYKHVSYIIRQNSSYKSNASYLERVTGSWTETGVTYNSQPTTSTANRVLLPQSTTSDQNYLNVDITALVQDIVNNPSSSFGLLLKLQTEQYYTRMAFCSKDHSDPSRHPQLTITYTMPTQQSSVIVGQGTEVSGNYTDTEVTPFGTYWHDNKSQYLFTKSELITAGMTMGIIDAIEFDVVHFGGRNLDNMQVHLGHTTQTSLSNFVSGLSLVYYGNYNITTGWNKVNFYQPFIWDGNSNLVVEVCFDNNSYTHNSTVRYSTTAQAMTYGEYEDDSHGCNPGNMEYGGASTKRPNIRFSVGMVSAFSGFEGAHSNNYIYTKNNLYKTSNNDTVFSEGFQYYDGLGRPIQKVDYMASPSGKDIIQPIEYDSYGREVKKNLPYTDESTGLYRDDWSTTQAAFYTTTMGYGAADGSKAYAETVFDNSPLNRVMKQGAPGDVWKVDNTTQERQSSEHVISIQYLSNVDSDSAYYWTISGSSYPNITFTRQTYSTYHLFKTITDDENNNPVTEFKDNQGKVVLKTDALQGKTYYIYDDFGLLRCVIPPLASLTLNKATSFNTSSGTSVFNELCYYYEYDYRNRMTKKKLPGTIGAYEMTYDNLDRLIETKDPNGHRIYTKYDIFSRPIETGNAITSQWLTKTHYDSYTKNGITYDGLSVLPYVNIYGYTKETSVKDKVTVTVTRVLDPATGMKDSIRSVNYYDKYGRIIEVVSDNHLGGRDIISNYYTYLVHDQIARTQHQHWKTAYSEGAPDHTLEEIFTYDHAGRLISTNQNIDGNSVQLSEMNYSEDGTLKTKKIGDALLTTDYKYNIRGWLTQMNNPNVYGSSGKLFNLALNYGESDNYDSYNGNITDMEWSDADGNQKFYSFEYDNLNRLKNGYFEQYYRGSYLSTKSNKYQVGFMYDANGNILTANRKGLLYEGSELIGNIDILTYKYFNSGKSNRLWAVGDAAADVLGRGDFYDRSNGNSSQEYTYDNNGNMTQDNNKGIYPEYNLLNLPKYILCNYNDVYISYSATGAKLCQHDPYGGFSRRDYIGPFVYKDGVLDYVITSEGRGVFTNGNFDYYEYQLKDHLGNVRVTFKKNGASTLVLQTNDYYPFGLLMGERYEASGTNENRYLYNGKEILSEENIDWLDYGARMYDPQLGRWHVPDVLGEIRVYESPYSYVGNNPISRIDPDGRYWGDKTNNNDEDDQIAKQQAALLKARVKSLSKQETRINNNIKAVKANTKLSTSKQNAQLTKLNNRLSNVQAMKTDVQAAQNELTAMGNADNISFTFNTVNSGNKITQITHGTTQPGGKGDLQITINNFGTFESRAHELKHGYQVLTGALVPVAGNSEVFSAVGFAHPQLAEVEAYKREYAVGQTTMPPSLIGGNINSMSDINQGWVAGIYVPGIPDPIDPTGRYRPYSSHHYNYR